MVYVDEHGVPYLTSSIQPASDPLTGTVEDTSVASLALPTTSDPVEPASMPSALPSTTSILPDNLTPTLLSSSTASTLVMAQWYTSPPTIAQSSTQSPSPSFVPSPSSLSQASMSSPSSKMPKNYSASGSKPNAAADDLLPLGVTYDPFTGTPGQCQCKSPQQMNAEFDQMKNFGIVRIYGNDCGVIPIAVHQAMKNGQKVMAGIYHPNQGVSDVVNALSDAVKRYNNGDWSIISLVSIENERVNAHVITASDAQDTISQARQALNGAGYFGPVGAVETVPAIVDNPSICTQSDWALVNIHAFFDPSTKAEDAGTFVRNQVAQVQQACPNKRVVVTESGWPHQGTSHDQAVVSLEAQAAAINSLRAAFTHDLFLFNAFDSPWKTDDATTWNAERYWGIL